LHEFDDRAADLDEADREEAVPDVERLGQDERGLVTQTRVASTQLSPSCGSSVGMPTWSNRDRSNCTPSPP
jgi:hypothetical protein